ncbi:uncharacterized protein EDB91DRAFT_1206247 [Suillus paluster]|uniref:uncharacterized protein n=1 Tax=Suillus paluster TaxID=48578 RepID=UPI001B875DC0|nr:uncharacterized protein EDB91DRAFT_1206247 [Suillus paluster]KAG1731996.1 hypothetical protein EDB91DRAFT_1206247 [Suillus paluster]
MQTQDQRRSPKRQDTFDLRDQIMADDHTASSHMHAHADATNTYAGASDEEHSVLEDDSDGEDREIEYMDEDDDRSSSLSIPNESIDFDLVYSLHSFAATVEGQASVVKGDSLFLMDDSNSYWWLVRVLKTQDVGYIPAENIETPFERLARLNKHRNVDLAHPTPQEVQEDVERVRNNLSSRAGSHHSPSPTPGFPATGAGQGKGVTFTTARSVHRYPPAVWHEEDEDEDDVEWDDGAYEEEDPDLAEEMLVRQRQGQMGRDEQQDAMSMQMEPDDGMSWDDGVAEDMQAQNAQKKMEQQMLMRPDALRPGGTPEKQQAQIQVQRLQPEILITEQDERQALAQQALRHQTSRDRIIVEVRPPSPLSPSKSIDPAEATETRKLSVTPSIARDDPVKQAPALSGPLLPSAIMQKQEDERQRTREEIEVLEEASKKKLKNKDKPLQPVSNTPVQKPAQVAGKLRKERDATDEEAKEKKEKKKGGVLGFFGRRKDKGKDKNSIETASNESRGSQESGRSSSNLHGPTPEPPMSPVTASAMQQQQQVLRTSNESRTPTRLQPQQTPQTPPQVQAQVSQHASQLRQRDQQQQALYQQYLNRSPSSPPEAPSYGLQSASAVLSSSSSYNTSASSAAGLGLGLPSSRPRPGSLVLSPTADGQGVGVPELSVIRVFAGKHLQTEATFKTVLLNASTTSADLVRQAIQRFRLPAGEDEADYYLTIKQVEGSSAVLLPEEKPLGVFESVVEAAMELPKVKRSSVGSISSVSSNLSMHPAIKKLSMNDFSDDSVVKFYLNRHREDADDSVTTEEGDETLQAEPSHDVAEGLNTSASSVNVTPDRFSSPTYRFTLQLVIHPEDLPDDMVFDPVTEAIVFKNTLRDRTQSTSSISSGVSQNQRRKVFTFPKNVTVAEVIELGLERFGILEGVVDGGDEVEDKNTKRRSISKVRYGLMADAGGQERELSPSSRVTEAYPRPPTFRRVQEGKRRSIDSAQLLGSLDDVHPDDPVFILRRAISYRTSSSRHRMSAPLDEIALQHFRDSISGSSLSSDNQSSATEEVKPRQLSRQEIIAAQRAASRASQKAILSAQMNSVRGVDVLLPGNAMIRSSRYDSGDKTRYSYVLDGESFDISDIVEQELCEGNSAQKSDLLEGVLGRNKEGMNEKIDRVLNKIKDGRLHAQYLIAAAPSQSDSVPSAGSAPSEYSVDDAVTARSGSDGRTPTPLAGGVTGTRRVASPVSDTSRTPTPTAADGRYGRARSTTPASKTGSSTPRSLRQSSIASVMSEVSMYATPTGQLISPPETPRIETAPKPQIVKRPYIPKDDFGVSHMMAIIEIAGSAPKAPQTSVHPVDELLFGKPVDVMSLHPDIQEIYAGAFQQLDEMDKTLDEYLQHAISAR